MCGKCKKMCGINVHWYLRNYIYMYHAHSFFNIVNRVFEIIWAQRTRFFFTRSASNYSENFDDVFCFCFKKNLFFVSIHEKITIDRVKFIQNICDEVCLQNMYVHIRINKERLRSTDKAQIDPTRCSFSKVNIKQTICGNVILRFNCRLVRVNRCTFMTSWLRFRKIRERRRFVWMNLNWNGTCSDYFEKLHDWLSLNAACFTSLSHRSLTLFISVKGGWSLYKQQTKMIGRY